MDMCPLGRHATPFKGLSYDHMLHSLTCMYLPPGMDTLHLTRQGHNEMRDMMILMELIKERLCI